MTDSFNGVLWVDDSHIVDLIARKRFTLDGRTGVEIRVEPVHLAEIAASHQAELAVPAL
jgi:Holliday junction resolvase RusA-like endonuclease